MSDDPLAAFYSDNPLDAAARHLSFVGAVASAWAGVEATLDIGAIEIAGIPFDVGVCFTAQVIGTARKLDAYIALVRLRNVDRYNSALDLFAKDTGALAERRNRVVHDAWAFSETSPSRLEMTARRSLRLRTVRAVPESC